MSKSQNTKTSISGESVALSFVGVGLLWAYLMPQLFGATTSYIAAIFVLFGFTGFMVEVQKRFKDGHSRWDNGGIGILLGSILGWLLYVSYTNTDGWIRGILCLALSIALLFAIAAVMDFVVSIFEYLVRRQESVAAKLTGLMKFATLTASTIAAVYVSLSQVI